MYDTPAFSLEPQIEAFPSSMLQSMNDNDGLTEDKGILASDEFVELPPEVAKGRCDGSVFTEGRRGHSVAQCAEDIDPGGPETRKQREEKSMLVQKTVSFAEQCGEKKDTTVIRNQRASGNPSADPASPRESTTPAGAELHLLESEFQDDTQFPSINMDRALTLSEENDFMIKRNTSMKPQTGQKFLRWRDMRATQSISSVQEIPGRHPSWRVPQNADGTTTSTQSKRQNADGATTDTQSKGQNAGAKEQATLHEAETALKEAVLDFIREWVSNIQDFEGEIAWPTLSELGECKAIHKARLRLRKASGSMPGHEWLEKNLGNDIEFFYGDGRRASAIVHDRPRSSTIEDRKVFVKPADM